MRPPGFRPRGAARNGIDHRHCQAGPFLQSVASFPIGAAGHLGIIADVGAAPAPFDDGESGVAPVAGTELEFSMSADLTRCDFLRMAAALPGAMASPGLLGAESTPAGRPAAHGLSR